MAVEQQVTRNFGSIKLLRNAHRKPGARGASLSSRSVELIHHVHWN